MTNHNISYHNGGRSGEADHGDDDDNDGQNA